MVPKELNVQGQTFFAGALSDLTFQVDVRITSSSIPDDLKKGVFVVLTGTIMHAYQPPHMLIDSVKDIIIKPAVPIANINDLQMGYCPLEKAAKRSLPNEDDRNNNPKVIGHQSDSEICLDNIAWFLMYVYNCFAGAESQ